MKDKVRMITYGGILSAVIMLVTFVTAIPIPIPNIYGYINFGDGVIFATAVILGPFAGVCAGLGSALADLIAGYAMYIPATFLIKGSMGLLAGLVLKMKPQLAWYWQIVLFAACEIIMVGGYFLFEGLFVYATGGRFIAASGALLANTIQGVAGIILGIGILPLARRIKL